MPDAPNVLRIPFALTPHVEREVSKADRELLDKLASPAPPAPHRRTDALLAPARSRASLAALRHLFEAAAADGGSVIAVGSPRTPDDLRSAIATAFEGATVPHLFAPDRGPPAYPALIEAADEIFVTADSVAMTADAVTTGKPVGLVPIAKSSLGRAVMAAMDRLRPGQRLYPRDLRFFWTALEEQGFAGTLDEPKASNPPDYAEIVADRVRRLLEQPPPPATGGRGNAR